MLQNGSILPKTLGLLKELMLKPALADFHLAGGTSLALQIGHRLSVDLDLFGNRPFEKQEILDEISDLAPIQLMHETKNILVLNVQDVKVDFVNYRYPLISKIKEIENIRLVGLEDIAAMKIAAITGRGKKRDFFDLYCLLKHFSLKEIFNFYSEKFDDGNQFMAARSLTYFLDADEDEDLNQLGVKIKWETIKQKIQSESKKHFGF